MSRASSLISDASVREIAHNCYRLAELNVADCQKLLMLPSRRLHNIAISSHIFLLSARLYSQITSPSPPPPAWVLGVRGHSVARGAAGS